MHELQKQVAKLLRINAEMAHKLESVAAGSALSSGASIAGSATSIRSVLSFSSVRTNFEVTLNNSRIYRRALPGQVNRPRPPAEQASAPSIQQSWSVLSGVSLSEVSNYSVYSLPISPQEFYNPTWYTKPDQIVTLDPRIPEVPTLLTRGFAEGLEIALEHKDMEIAKILANYIPWNVVLQMGELYPTSAGGPNSAHNVVDRLTLFKLWLQSGGDAKVKDEHGRTAIMRAVEVGDERVLKLLIPKALDILSSTSALHIVSGGAREVFMLGLCKEIEMKDKAETTPMDCGLGGKRALLAKILLELGADINATGWKKGTALHEACRNGRREVVEVLLSHGADIEAKDSEGATALHRACRNGCREVVEALLSHGADIEARDELGDTALHDACSYGHREAVESLLSHGADIEAKNSEEATALHGACRNGHREVVESLLSRGADIEGTNQRSETALHWACSNGCREVVEVLLNHGADTEAKDILGSTALARLR